MAALGIELSATGEQTMITLNGELDMDSAPDLITMADAAMTRRNMNALAFDMEAVTFLDSAGVGAIAAIDRECLARGVSFRITTPSRPVRRVLDLIGLTEWIEPTTE
jgi:anti-anti-sigma factor